ncbi:hypothetical protein [Mesorhizobium sp. B2-4-6]|uniref:hypothetical protein n=1 Tax=Mesorhizobium sp. B2-4-6 TaxID=2589943 RepID=UPI00112B9C3D|nr:hypothetical protein [Mesorhizobium sp. B2-4-6]TPL36012.1 hypothetical protein FJ957_29885 [Mesorhizobium sp. B2-4-6]
MQFNYHIPEKKLAGHRALKQIADTHRVDLRTTAMQFSAAPDVVVALVVGAANSGRVLANVTAMKRRIPADFWAALKAEGLIERSAPVPQGLSSLPEISSDGSFEEDLA